MKLTRRQLLLGGGILGGGAYINHRGLRYPRLSFEPIALADTRKYPAAEIKLNDFIFVDGRLSTAEINIRAIAPEPELKVTGGNGKFSISVNNIAQNAQLNVNESLQTNISEDIDGISRTVWIQDTSNKELHLKWTLPQADAVEFAIIGDSGGGAELSWCISRAQQLDAQFLLHLGDFNYSPGEYQKAINQFHAAPMPVYVSIGNHDFNDSGLVYHHFRQQIGPMNNAFSIAGHHFVNIDSAASLFPVYAGNRARLFKQLERSRQTFSDQLVFTHKPFKDSREGQDHEMSGIGEIDWVHDTMLDFGITNLLCGHVHRSTRIEFEGITQWTAGEGLGFEDIRHQKQVAKILMGTARKGEKLEFRWEPLNMPWPLHTSPTHIPKLKRQGLQQQLEWYRQLLS